MDLNKIQELKETKIPELIKSIHIDKSNLEHIAKTKNINGTLLSEIKRVMIEYKNQD